MTARKPLEEGCNGGIFCEVERHIEAVRSSRGTTYRHVRLTRGQYKTLRERWDAQREARAASAVTEQGENHG